MDNAGLVIRTATGLYICYVKKWKLEIQTYSDFLADQTNLYVKIRFKDKLIEENEIREMKKMNSLFFEKIKK